MWGYSEYVSVAKKQQYARDSAKKLEKKLGKVDPIKVIGRKIAKSWWGIKWNDNLENYADYSNRLPRGRSFLKNGTFVHLSIVKNEILAYIQGTYKKPYEVKVVIDELDKKIKDKIINICKENLGSIKDLLEGSFPKELADIFTKKGEGLFPTNKQIHFNCSCPDGAYLCKHVAATLYGIAVKFDEDPALFFSLRSMNINELISDVVMDQSNDLLTRASKVKSRRVIKDKDIKNIFNMDI